MARNEEYITFPLSNITTTVKDPLLPALWNFNEACYDYRNLNLSFSRNKHYNHALHSNQLVKKLSLAKQDIETVEKFVFFVGYPRSGHSVIASMMDAHPNMIIAHEFNIFREWKKMAKTRRHLYDYLYRNSVYSSVAGWRSNVRDRKGYTLGLDYKWQGKFETLKVIGDKSGAVTTQMFHKDPESFMMMLDELKFTVGVDVRVIHVVRNPFDMIATRLLYQDGDKKRKLPATKEQKHCNVYGLSYQLNRTFALISSANKFFNLTSLTRLDIHHADLIKYPNATMEMICRFLGIPCSSDYLEACHRKVFRRASQTRNLVKWPKKLIVQVYKQSKPYSFLWRYSFQGD